MSRNVPTAAPTACDEHRPRLGLYRISIVDLSQEA